jgi:hypothetical protein
MAVLDQMSKKQISLTAKGLYITLLVNVPEDKAVSLEGIKGLCNESTNKLYQCLQELQTTGLIKRFFSRSGGQKKNVFYKVNRDTSFLVNSY